MRIYPSGGNFQREWRKCFREQQCPWKFVSCHYKTFIIILDDLCYLDLCWSISSTAQITEEIYVVYGLAISASAHDHDQSDEWVGVIKYKPYGLICEVEEGERKPAEEKYCDHRDQKLARPAKFKQACTGRSSKSNLSVQCSQEWLGVM